MSLVRTTFFNTFAIGIRLVSGLVLNKVLAVLIGPAGYAIIGQFQNSTQFVYSVAGGSISNGVVKYTAEYGDDEHRLRTLWSTALQMVGSMSIVLSILIAVFSGVLSRRLMGDSSYQGVFVILAIALTLYSVNSLLLAILNGRKELRITILSNIAGSVIILVTMLTLTPLFGVRGALVAWATNQALIAIVTVPLAVRRGWFKLDRFAGRFSRGIAFKLLGFAVMTLASAVGINLGQVAVRRIMITAIDVQHAGYWDAMAKLSGINIMIASAGMSFYFLPRMAELQLWPDMWAEIKRGVSVLVPMVILVSGGAYVLRDFIVHLLYSPAFAPMEQLFAWQLAGDALRITSWFFAYVMIGREMIVAYVLSELLGNLLLVCLSWWFVHVYGFKGVAIAYFVTFAIVLVGMYLAARFALPPPHRVEENEVVVLPGTAEEIGA